MKLSTTQQAALIAFFSFIALKFSLWPAAFIYPFCLYYILKQNSTKAATAWLFGLGVLYFFSLFLWATLTGIELNLYGGFVSGVIFGLSGLLFKLTEAFVYPRAQWLNYIDFLLWPAYFYLIQQTVFPLLFVDATYLLDVPPFLPFLYHYIGSGGMHLVIMGTSIFLGVAWQQKMHWSLRGLATAIVASLILAHGTWLSAPVEAANEDSVLVALIQGNFHQEIDWKRQNATVLFEYYEEKIAEAANQGADIIVVPENAILLWSFDLDKGHALYQLQDLSYKSDSIIVFSSLETIPGGKVESRGYVITPEGGIQAPYAAQKVYDYIKQRGTFSIGDTVVTYPTKFGELRLLICFEALFRNQLDKEKDLDYDHIIVMANNQFLPSHRGLKTLEWNVQDIAGTYRKNVLYASNNGPTAIVDRTGKITDKLAYDTEGILWGHIELKP